MTFIIHYLWKTTVGSFRQPWKHFSPHWRIPPLAQETFGKCFSIQQHPRIISVVESSSTIKGYIFLMKEVDPKLDSEQAMSNHTLFQGFSKDGMII